MFAIFLQIFIYLDIFYALMRYLFWIYLPIMVLQNYVPVKKFLTKSSMNEILYNLQKKAEKLFTV